jgi:hypothetical protein
LAPPPTVSGHRRCSRREIIAARRRYHGIGFAGRSPAKLSIGRTPAGRVENGHCAYASDALVVGMLSKPKLFRHRREELRASTTLCAGPPADKRVGGVPPIRLLCLQSRSESG